jgi:uncharacterized protein YodC (DUF2158 family)
MTKGFKVGDIVQHQSGGPEMIVERVGPEDHNARVRRWFDGGPLPKVWCRYEDGTKRWVRPEELELVRREESAG